MWERLKLTLMIILVLLLALVGLQQARLEAQVENLSNIEEVR